MEKFRQGPFSGQEKSSVTSTMAVPMNQGVEYAVANLSVWISGLLNQTGVGSLCHT